MLVYCSSQFPLVISVQFREYTLMLLSSSERSESASSSDIITITDDDELIILTTHLQVNHYTIYTE